MTYTTSPDLPPPFTMCDYYERSGDPFHVSAFEGTGIDHKTVVLVGGEKINYKQNRRQGWMAVDYCENAVGFYPDGTVIDGEPPECILRKGYFADGRMFAYPKSHWVNELFDRHRMYAADKGVDYE